MGDSDFQREVLGRLMRIETILTRCPDCQKSVTEHDKTLAKLDERVNNIYHTAGILAAVISAAVSFAGFIIDTIKGMR